MDRTAARSQVRRLRASGLSYGEIASQVPVPKSTIATWCADIELTDAQRAAIVARTKPEPGTPRDTQRRRREEIARIREEALAEVPRLIREPLWVAGTSLYWGEGAKTDNRLSLSNADPRAHRVFIPWVRTYLDPFAAFVLFLIVHEQCQQAPARRYWSRELGLPMDSFTKTYVKPPTSGQRLNKLPHGICQTRVRASSNHLHRVLAWTDGLAERLPTTWGSPYN